MKLIETSLPGCKLIEPQVFADSRGAFYESWNKVRWAQLGLDVDFVQSNVSMSERGVLRVAGQQRRGRQCLAHR